MRKIIWGLVLTSFVGAAGASDNAISDARYADGNDYSARLFYNLSFGGQQAGAQAMGLRFDNEFAAARGAPALFQASFDGGQSLPRVSLQGVEVAGPALAANQDKGGGMFSGLNAAQWIGIAFTGIVFGSIMVEASDSDDTPAPSGTGAN